MGDKAYSSKANREKLRDRGIWPAVCSRLPREATGRRCSGFSPRVEMAPNLMLFYLLSVYSIDIALTRPKLGSSFQCICVKGKLDQAKIVEASRRFTVIEHRTHRQLV